jgi:hypothetical protein
MHERVSQRSKVNPVVRVQMRDCYSTDVRQFLDADARCKWPVGAVT